MKLDGVESRPEIKRPLDSPGGLVAERRGIQVVADGAWDCVYVLASAEDTAEMLGRDPAVESVLPVPIGQTIRHPPRMLMTWSVERSWTMISNPSSKNRDSPFATTWRASRFEGTVIHPN